MLYGFVGVQTLGLELPGFNQFGSVQSLEQGMLYGFVAVLLCSEPLIIPTKIHNLQSHVSGVVPAK